MFKQFFILIVIYARYSSCTIDATYTAGKELWKLFSMMSKVELDTPQSISEVIDLLDDGKYQEIKDQRNKLHGLLHKMDESINSVNSKSIRNLIKLPPSEIMLYKCMDTFEILIQSIDENYEEFQKYKLTDGYRVDDGSDYLMKITMDVENKILIIRKMMTIAGTLLPHDKNLLFAITGYASTLHSEICNSPRIISNLLIDLFTMAMIAEIKVNIMAGFANIKRFSDNEAWKIMNSIAEKQFAKLFGDYVKTLELNMELTEVVYLRACDPSDGNWIRNEGFYELEGTFQTTIFSYHWATCKYYSCNTAWYRKASCEPKFYDTRTQCTDTIAECAYLGAVHICVLKDGPHKFQYVNSTEMGFLGRDPKCPTNNGYLIEDGIGWNWIYAACACNCYGNHNKISLMIMESNVKRNKVITGFRFVRKDNILYLQPREAKLSTNAYVSRYSENWVKFPNSIDKSELHSINKENRVFFFDDLRLPSGYVLTGVKFNKVTRGTVTGFALEIFGVQFDYETGELHSEADNRISVKSWSTEPGKELLFEAISSINTKSMNILSSRKVKYVSLERSKLEDDFGQSTLPFFDGVHVKVAFPSPLSGIGIFHKGVDGYAGFISLRVYGLSYRNYLIDFQSAHMKNGRISFNETEPH